ncbi:GGDEF domain-containing protein [Caproicibacterium argilliputei]|uniref:GGDEF domain-containing protein n=1 Tax=Caproicibacterium argilliputei TaxID=3030016 RepID=A0AA97DBC5_9FIRM|nr:GGDEF domain-containing protein [Caproicibacterium argilliputei]WOC32654.1 GGDEF domain-containing protein [Caproicibacterium argilliputei]
MMNKHFHLSVKNMRVMLSCLQNLFDLVRLVDPVSTSLLILDDDRHFHREPYTCFRIWDKPYRCSNCISMDACLHNTEKMKYEFVGKDVLCMTSRPIYLDMETQSVKVALELVCCVSDASFLHKPDGGKSMAELLDETSRQLYRDELTGAYNRRYFNEFRFLHKGQNRLSSQLALLLLDVHKFKAINDTLGHLFGDRVLQQVADTLQSKIRREDSLIRLGGDEFVIILTGCAEAEVLPKIVELQAAVSRIAFPESDGLQVTIDCGYAYTVHFQASQSFLASMVETADKWMYKNKKEAIQYITPPPASI